MGVRGTSSLTREPRARSSATASAWTSVMPRPARAEATTAPWVPRVSCGGSSSKSVEQPQRGVEQPGAAAAHQPGGPGQVVAAARGADHDQGVLPAGTKPQVRSVRGPATDDQVDLVVAQMVEQLVPGRDRHPQDDVREPPPEAREHRREHDLARRGDGADPQPSFLSRLHGRVRLLEQPGDGAAVVGVHLSGGRDAQPPALAREQVGSELARQLADRGRHRRFGHVQLGRRRPHRAGAHHRQEGPQPARTDVGHRIHKAKHTSAKS